MRFLIATFLTLFIVSSAVGGVPHSDIHNPLPPVKKAIHHVPVVHHSHPLVSIGPYIGLPISFNGSELVVNTPSINEDVALLNVRKSEWNFYRGHDYKGEMKGFGHPHLILSGALRGQASYDHRATGRGASDFDLVGAELDSMIEITPCVTGYMSMNYDNSLAGASASRIANSRLFMKKAFLVLGNFNYSGGYASFGQMYVPFGTYSSNMISSPLGQALGRTRARAGVLGYQGQGDNAPFASFFLFKGDSFSRSRNNLNNGGFNLGYGFATHNWTGKFGLSYIHNIADAEGVQATGGTGFSGFSLGAGTPEKLLRRVHAVALYGKLNRGAFHLLSEYIGATSRFNAADLSYNDRPAKPKAWNVEGAYTFICFNRPSAIALGYSRAQETLALNIPRSRVAIAFNTSLWRHTIFSIELREDKSYHRGDVATGNSAAVTVAGLGHRDTGIKAKLDIYF
jgi:hypothetical protein